MNSYDIETFKKDGLFIPYCVCFILKNKNYSLYYNDSDDIILKSIEVIFNLIDKDIVIYIHNIKFDGSFIIRSISKKKEKFLISAVIENKNVYAITLIYLQKKIIFKCSYKLLPLSLESIAKGFNLNKKIDFPYEFINDKTLFWKNSIDLQFFKSLDGMLYYQNKYYDIKKFTIDYCLNDCHITKQFVEKIQSIFLKELKINIINNNILSAASLSFHIYYKKFNTKKVDKKISKEVENYIRDSYFGGRCEVFGNPKKDEYVYHFDFPGMYGLCMKENNVYGKPKFYYNLDKNLKLSPGFYNITWKSNMYIPILPHHNVITNKLLFTNGEGNGTYWFEEINLFKENGGIIININSGLIYSKYDKVFKDFVEYFEKFRKINETYKTLGKFMINSFYGRTGLKSREVVSFFIVDEDKLNELIELSNINRIDISSLEEINDIWFISINLTEISLKILLKLGYKIYKEKSFNIAIASSITSKARIKLYQGFKSVEKADGRILYCDTDSIIAAYKKKVDDEIHGEVYWDTKKNDTKIKDAVFIAPKTYSIKYNNNQVVSKIKGIRRNYIDMDTIKTSFYLKENITVFNIEQIINFNFKIEYRKINKFIDLIGYDKRKFNIDLKTTEPLQYKDGYYL